MKYNLYGTSFTVISISDEERYIVNFLGELGNPINQLFDLKDEYKKNKNVACTEIKLRLIKEDFLKKINKMKELSNQGFRACEMFYEESEEVCNLLHLVSLSNINKIELDTPVCRSYFSKKRNYMFYLPKFKFNES